MKSARSHPSLVNPSSAVYRARLHWINYVKPSLLMIIGLPGVPYVILYLYKYAPDGIFPIVFVAQTAIFLVGLVRTVLLYRTRIELSVDNLTITRGLFSKVSRDLPLRKILGYEVKVSLLGRIFNYGTLHVSTGMYDVKLAIASPKALLAEMIKYANPYAVSKSGAKFAASTEYKNIGRAIVKKTKF